MAIAAGAGLLVGTACCAIALLPALQDIEQEAGLRWLFQARGKVPVPSDVVIVAINRSAASRIWLPREPAGFLRCRNWTVGRGPATHDPLPEIPFRWPRCMHAILVDRLAAAGARVIAFDVLFRKRPPAGAGDDLQAWQDGELARSFASRPVLVAQKLEEVDGRQSLVELSPAIAEAALGVAPFPLYRGKHDRVDEFKAFEDVDWATPTLPTLALQAYALDTYPLLSSLLAQAYPDGDLVEPVSAAEHQPRTGLQATCVVMRHLIRKRPTMPGDLLAQIERTETPGIAPEALLRLRAVLSMYRGPADRLINFYGPAASFRSVGYDEALGASPGRMRELFGGRAVFVGYAEFARHEQVEHFPTVVASGSDPRLSGVEIAATAFSNLLQDNSIRRAEERHALTLVFVSGFFATVICRVIPWKAALPTMGVAIAAGAGIVLYQFSSRMLWLPLVGPFLVAVPGGMLTAFAWNFHTTWRQRENLREALVQFVPGDVATQFERNAGSIPSTRRNMACGCLATDAANYTPLAERMASAELAEFLNQYFDALFRPVGTQGGFVSDVVGDAMLALWPEHSGSTRAGMLDALLQMRDAARHFNEHSAHGRLRTRFGADWGPITLATVGAYRHYEYRAVGDTVNTASRIQELNKKLGTDVLLSRRSIGTEGEGYLTRDLGAFLLRGKSVALEICELVEARRNATARQIALCRASMEALALIRADDRRSAIAALRELHAEYPHDGPTTFYLRRLARGRPTHHGVFKVS